MRTLDEFAGKAHEELNTSKEELLTLLKDADVLADLGFDTTTIMAMFIPNTYQIYWNTPALDLLKRMKKEYHRFCKSIGNWTFPGTSNYVGLDH